jgi:hypothetical protein
MKPDRNLRAIIDDPGSTPKERAVARLRLDATTEGNEPPSFSLEAQELLRTLGKNHLRDVAESEWMQYATRHGITGREPLAIEYSNWHCPDIEFLVLIHGKDPLAATIQHWTSVHNRTADPHVKAHALDQIKQLENNGDGR